MQILKLFEFEINFNLNPFLILLDQKIKKWNSK